MPALGGSDGRAPTQLDDHLLAVIAGALVPHLFQGAGSLSQQDRSLARRGEKGQGKVAAGQQDGCGSLPLAWQGVQFTLLAALGSASPQAVLQQLVGAGGAGTRHQAHGGLMEEDLAIGRSEAMGQLAQAAKVALEARQLRGRGVVGLTQGLAGIRLLLPQAGAEREQQVTGQQLDHIVEDCAGDATAHVEAVPQVTAGPLAVTQGVLLSICLPRQ